MKTVKITRKRHTLIPILIILAAIFIAKFVQNKNRGLIVGTSPVVPPFTYVGGESGDELLGFDIKLIEEIAKDYGENFTIKVMYYDELLWAVERGEIDMVVSAFTVTEYGKQYVDYSQLYYRIPQVLIVREDDESLRDIHTKFELGKTKKIGTLSHSAGISVISEISEGDVFVRDAWELAIESLLTSDIDAIVMEIDLAKEFILKYSNIMISPIDLELESYAVAVKKGNTKLLNSINQTLNRLVSSGRHRELVEENIRSYSKTTD